MRLLVLLLLALPVAAQTCERIFDTPVRYLAGTARDLLTADFDSDGRPDLLVALDAPPGAPAGLTLLLNRPGGFVEGTPVPLPSGALRLFAEDVNGDGRPDAIAMGSDYLATILSNRNGTFATVVTDLAGDPLQQWTSSFPATYGDFDGDGRGDLVVGLTKGNRTGFLRVFRRRADHTFSEPVAQRQVVRWLWGLSAGDIDGDGKLDLAFADRTMGGWFQGNGDGTFGPQQTLTTASPTVVLAADFDRDARADVMFAGGVFLTSKNLTSVPHSAFGSGFRTAADLDGDGKLDILTGTFAYRGNGDGTFTMMDAGPTGNVGRHVVADFDGDGWLDTAANSDGIVIRYGLANGGLSGGSVLPGYSGFPTLLVTDLNGDRRDDMIVRETGLVYTADAAGVPRFAWAPSTFSDRRVAPGDYNGDGRIDLAFVAFETSVAFGSGLTPPFGELQPATSFHSTYVARDAVAADLNGDGKLDIALGASDGVVRLIGDGAGHFTDGGLTTLPADDVEGIAVADVNRDGRPDIVVQTSGPANDLYLVDGSTAVKIASGTALRPVIADIDGDTLLDILTFSYPQQGLVVFGGNGNGTFRSARTIAEYEDGQYPGFAVADFSGDGRPDVFFTFSDSGRAHLLVQQPDGAFTLAQRLFTEDWTGPAAGDFDGDSHPDIIFTASRTGTLYAHLARCRDAIRVAPPPVRLTASGRAITLEVPSTAAGTVTFYRRGLSLLDWVAIGRAPVVNGRATLLTTLPAGPYVFSAVYSGSGPHGRAESDAITHTVADGPPKRRTVRH